MLKVVIVGYGEMFTNLIAGALDAKCNIVGVLTRETVRLNPLLKWFKDLIAPSIEHSYIKSYNLYEIKAKGVNTKEFRAELLSLNPDLILVGSWGEKFEKATYSIPKTATINAHPSLLPKYRGPNPYFWVIKNQEKESGVTFHLMDEGFDTGAILAQEIIKISKNETGKSLKEKTVLKARGVLCGLLENLAEDIIIPLQQREEVSSYYSHPDDLELDFKKSAEENFALIRAAYPWREAYFYHYISAIAPNHNFVRILENKSGYNVAGTIVDVDPKKRKISVLCGDNNILEMEQLHLYKKIDRPFTKNYILRDIKIGDVID